MQLDVDDCQLHVEVDGPDDAPAVLLWNGARCTLRQWDLVVPRLMDRYRLLRFDVRGIGESTPSASYNFETYADDANRLLDSAGVTQCHVWSMAGDPGPR